VREIENFLREKGKRIFENVRRMRKKESDLFAFDTGQLAQIFLKYLIMKRIHNQTKAQRKAI